MHSFLWRSRSRRSRASDAPDALSARALGRAGHHGGRRICAPCRSTPAHDAVRGALEPAGGGARQRAQGVALSGQYCRSSMVANIFGSQGEYWGPGPWSIPEVAYTDESFNYMFVGSVPIVLLLWFGVAGGGAFRRGRLLLTGVLVAALALRARPLYAGLHLRVRLGAGRRQVPSAGRRQFRVRGRARLAGRISARRLCARGAAAPACDRVHCGGRMRACDGGLGSDVHGAVRPHGDADSSRCSRPRRSRSPSSSCSRWRARRAPRAVAAVVVATIAVADLLWWNVAFRLNAETRSSYAVLEQSRPANAPGARPPRTRRPRAPACGRAPAHRGRRNGRRPGRTSRSCAGSRRPTATIRCASASTIVWCRPASRTGSWTCAISRLIRRLRLCARARARARIRRARPADRAGAASGAPSRSPTCCRPGPKVWIYRLRDPAPRLKFTRRIQVADADATGGNGQLLVSPSPDRVLIDDDTPPSHRYDVAALGDQRRARPHRRLASGPDRDRGRQRARRHAGAARHLVSGLDRRDRRRARADPARRRAVPRRRSCRPGGTAWCSTSRRSGSTISATRSSWCCTGIEQARHRCGCSRRLARTNFRINAVLTRPHKAAGEADHECAIEHRLTRPRTNGRCRR